MQLSYDDNAESAAKSELAMGSDPTPLSASLLYRSGRHVLVSPVLTIYNAHAVAKAATRQQHVHN